MTQARFGGNAVVGKRAPLERLPMGPVKKAPTVARTGGAQPKNALLKPAALVGVRIGKSYIPQMHGVSATGRYKRAVDLNLFERRALRRAIGVQRDAHQALHSGKVRLMRGASGKVTGTVGPQYFLEQPAYRGELARQVRRHVPVEGRLLHHVEAGPDLSRRVPAGTFQNTRTQSVVEAPRRHRANGDVTKSYRRHDPESARQRRLGGAIAGSAIGGGALVYSGAGDIARDTRGARAASSRVSGRDVRLTRWMPVEGPLQRGKKRRMSFAAMNPPDLTRQEREGLGALRDAAVVRGHAAGKIGAGLGLVGLGATLARRSHTRRWD